MFVCCRDAVCGPEMNPNRKSIVLLLPPPSSSSSSLEFYSLCILINLKGPFSTFYRNSNSLNGWFQMAECECFELTLLICERVCGPERNWRPLRHMGSRFTPRPFKDTSKPRWPLAQRSPVLHWQGHCGCLSGTHIHINKANMRLKRLLYSLTCMATHPLLQKDCDGA